MANPRRFIDRALVRRGAREERARRMAAIGKTRWGQAWLGALRQVDHENRLGRGLELARQGAVEGLHFAAPGEVRAEVRGSQPAPYRVQLSLKPFTPEQTRALLAEVARRPDWLDLLLDGQLPPGIEQVLAQAHVQLFPHSWRDLAMRCTCPDAAVPCKHLAALLYQLAGDFDDDPSLLFAIRGLALEDELRRVSELDGLAPTPLRDLRTERQFDGLQLASTATARLAESAPEPEAERQFDEVQLAHGAPPPIEAASAISATPFLDTWALLLPARPPFFRAGNLAEHYVSYLRAAATFWQTGRDDDDDEDHAAEETSHGNAPAAIPAYGLPDVPLWRAHALHLELDAAGSFREAVLLDGAGATVHTFGKEVALLSYLERLDRHAATAAPVAHGVVAIAFRLARRLVAAGAVVPRLLSLGDDVYRVRWGAATQDASVAEAVRQLARHPGLASAVRYAETLAREETDAEWRARVGAEIAASLGADESETDDLTKDHTSAADQAGARDPAFVDEPRDDHRMRWYAPVPADAPHALLGALLRPMLLAGVQEVLAQADHAAVQLLFLGRPVDLSNTGDTQLALALPLWLRRLSLDTSQHRLLVQIEEIPGAPGRYALRPLLVLEAADAPEPVPISEVARGDFGELLRLQVVRDLALLAESYPPLRAFVDERAGIPEYIELYGADFASFLFEVAPALRLVGAQLLMPHGLDRVARPRLSAVLVAGEAGSTATASGQATASAKTGAGAPQRGLLGLNALVDFDWQVAVGDDGLMNAGEFADLTDRYEGIVRLRDGFVWLEPLQTARLLARLAQPPRPSAAVTLQSMLLGTFQGAPLRLSEGVARLRQNLLRVDDGAVAELRLDGLRATLRPYQQVGLAWLHRNAEAGLGSLLADDMGLGKTLQTIALLEHYRASGRWSGAPVLIVLPTSLITNWQREFDRFAPGLRVGIYHGPGRKPRVLAKADVVLTSYGIVRSDTEKLRAFNWGALVIDEAQQIKNPDAAQTEAVKSLTAPIRIALSGTPVENRLSEYWSVLDFANPGYLGPLEQFRATYALPIERDRDSAVLEAFRRVTAPLLLRRLKTDRSVIDDLPDKITQVEYCHLEPEQAALYQQVVETQLRELAAADETMRRARLLKFMTAVKQVCNHPVHYLRRGARTIEASGKAQRLAELTEAALAGGERVLVFTQYRQMGELLADLLHGRLGFRPPFLHGGLDRAERDALVAGMQDGSGPPVLILSIKAGGTGLNLTAANHVIHYDLWWNPAVESQATDRAYRIGQRRHVHVHRLITAGTFEERIDRMLEQKRELADLTVGAGGAWLGELAEELVRG